MCFKIISRAETINFDGEFFRLKNMRILHPSSRKRIPVYLGAVNSGMIKLATEEADGIILYLRPLDEIKKTTEFIKSVLSSKSNFEICLYLSRRFQTTILIWHTQNAKRWRFMWLWVNYYNKFLSSHGFEDEVKQITTEYQKNGIESTIKYVPDSMLDSLTING